MTSSALQSQKWQLIGISQWCWSALRGHPLPALTDNWTHAAASRHTIALISHTRHSPCSRSYYSFPVPLRVGGWVGLNGYDVLRTELSARLIMCCSFSMRWPAVSRQTSLFCVWHKSWQVFHSFFFSFNRGYQFFSVFVCSEPGVFYCFFLHWTTLDASVVHHIILCFHAFGIFNIYKNNCFGSLTIRWRKFEYQFFKVNFKRLLTEEVKYTVCLKKCPKFDKFNTHPPIFTIFGRSHQQRFKNQLQV